MSSATSALYNHGDSLGLVNTKEIHSRPCCCSAMGTVRAWSTQKKSTRSPPPIFAAPASCPISSTPLSPAQQPPRDRFLETSPPRDLPTMTKHGARRQCEQRTALHLPATNRAPPCDGTTRRHCERRDGWGHERRHALHPDDGDATSSSGRWGDGGSTRSSWRSRRD